jgi:hypothetical protein
MQSNAVNGTLRLHYDSLLETLTGSWRSGSDWHYFAPQYIGHWDMAPADHFTAILVGSGGASRSSAKGPVIRSGEAYFRNFKAGAAGPDIALSVLTGGDLVDGSRGLDMGHAAVGEAISKTLIIRNDGTAPLRLSHIRWAGVSTGDFSVEGRLKRTLRPGEKARLKVIFRAQGAGVKSVTMKISTNDVDESPFDIRITGRAGP